jgi:hypothetical protein
MAGLIAVTVDEVVAAATGLAAGKAAGGGNLGTDDVVANFPY